jgi:glycosyltransferase involved in cell wall biosynthesis
MKNKGRKLKIAVAVTAKVSFPVKNKSYLFYSPLKVALDISEGLAKKGHKVTFFGPTSSTSKIFKTVPIPISPIYEDRKLLKMQDVSPDIQIKDREKMLVLLEQYFFSCIFKECQKEKFDIIHIHAPNEAMPLVFYSSIKTPIIYTIHDAIYPWRRLVFEKFQTDNQYFISISKFQQKKAPNLNWIANVYNGIKITDYPFSFYPKPKNQLLFLGRLLDRKGVAEAIQVAMKTKEKLLIAGDPNKGSFWEEKIKPYLKKENINYAGFIPYWQTHRYYGQSKVLLCPIKWDEPFGLTLVEAMACGTPVIAFKRGSVPEIILDGKTGFIVNPLNKKNKPNIDGLAKAIKKIYQMPDSKYREMRYNCRKRVEKNFTVEKMVNEYEKTYYKILKNKK